MVAGVVVLFFEGDEDLDDVAEDADLGLGGVEVDDAVAGVVVEDGLGVALVDLEALLDDRLVRVIDAVLLQGAAAEVPLAVTTGWTPK